MGHSKFSNLYSVTVGTPYEKKKVEEVVENHPSTCAMGHLEGKKCLNLQRK